MKIRRDKNGVERLVVGAACLGMALLLGGCHRRRMPPILPAVLHAPDLPPPLPAEPAMVSPLPDSILTAPPVKVTEARPRRTPRRATPKNPASDTAAPSDTVNPPSEDVPVGELGELSAGGQSNSQTMQEASELIASSEGRLNGLPRATTAQQPSQFRRVRYFLKQAQQAFNSGDAEGAKTLATKAKLLMDDLVK